MSNQHGGPPGAPPPAGAYGPGQTVLGGGASSPYPAPPAPPAHSAGAPIPPTTVRDAHTDFGGAPAYPPSPYEAPAPYGTPGSLYGGSGSGSGSTSVDDPRFEPAPPLVEPIGVPPPPRGRGRARGPSMAVIGLASFVVIGTVITAIVLVRRPSSSDDKPAPAAEVPAPIRAPADAGVPAPPPEQPTAAPAPSPAPRPAPQRPSQMLRPANGRPGRPPGLPGNNGPNGPFNPRLPLQLPH